MFNFFVSVVLDSGKAILMSVLSWDPNAAVLYWGVWEWDIHTFVQSQFVRRYYLHYTNKGNYKHATYKLLAQTCKISQVIYLYNYVKYFIFSLLLQKTLCLLLWRSWQVDWYCVREGGVITSWDGCQSAKWISWTVRTSSLSVIME